MHAQARRLTVRVALAASALFGCAPTRALAPLEPGHGALTMSLGGPIVEVFGGPLPLPISSVGYVRGIDGKANVHGALYPTNLALFGVFGFDLGASYELLAPDRARPRVMADVTAYTFFGNLAEGEPSGGLRVFPDVQVIAAWPLGDERTHNVPYVGVDQFVQPFPTLHWTPSLVFGDEVRLGRKVGLQLEGKWIAPWVDTNRLVTHWYGIDRRGGFSAQVGVTFYGGGAP